LTDTLLARHDRGGAQFALAPSFPCLRAVADRLSGSSILLAAQNVHDRDAGAFTGEVSPGMLAELGVQLVIVGHSERRQLCGEDDQQVARKVAAAQRHGIVPLLCVGETKAERDAGRTLEVVARQLRLALASADTTEIVVAYEPVWAIGTGDVATPAQVEEVHALLRDRLAALAGDSAAATTRILYGGSVTLDNAPTLLALAEVDGALVGGASLDAPGLVAIATAAR
jgi:triosephosphate isomerase